jgi:hypothetical protein
VTPSAPFEIASGPPLAKASIMKTEDGPLRTTVTNATIPLMAVAPSILDAIVLYVALFLMLVVGCQFYFAAHILKARIPLRDRRLEMNFPSSCCLP